MSLAPHFNQLGAAQCGSVRLLGRLFSRLIVAHWFSASMTSSIRRVLNVCSTAIMSMLCEIKTRSSGGANVYSILSQHTRRQLHWRTCCLSGVQYKLTFRVAAPSALVYVPWGPLAASSRCFFMHLSCSHKEVLKKLSFTLTDFYKPDALDEGYDTMAVEGRQTTILQMVPCRQ